MLWRSEPKYTNRLNLQFTALNMLNGPTLSKNYVSVSHLDYMAYTENQSGALLLYSCDQT